MRPRTGVRIVAILAVLAAGVHTALEYRVFQRDLKTYMNVEIGDSKQEVAYLLGFPQHVGVLETSRFGLNIRLLEGIPPNRVASDYAHWLYDPDFRVDFDRSGTVEEVSCFDLDEPSDVCPALHSVQIGASESDLLRILGTPTSTRYSGPSKLMSYDDLGAEYTLIRERVYAISLRKPQFTNEPFRRFLRSLLA